MQVCAKHSAPTLVKDEIILKAINEVFGLRQSSAVTEEICLRVLRNKAPLCGAAIFERRLESLFNDEVFTSTGTQTSQFLSLNLQSSYRTVARQV